METGTVFQRFSFTSQTSDPGRNLEKRFSKFQTSRKKSEMAISASRTSSVSQFTVISSVVQSARISARTLSMPLLGRSLRAYASEGDEEAFVSERRTAHSSERFDFREFFPHDFFNFDRETVDPFRVHGQRIRDGLDGESGDGSVPVGESHSNDDPVSSDRRHKRTFRLVRPVRKRQGNRCSGRSSFRPAAHVLGRRADI